MLPVSDAPPSAKRKFPPVIRMSYRVTSLSKPQAAYDGSRATPARRNIPRARPNGSYLTQQRRAIRPLESHFAPNVTVHYANLPPSCIATVGEVRVSLQFASRLVTRVVPAQSIAVRHHEVGSGRALSDRLSGTPRPIIWSGFYCIRILLGWSELEIYPPPRAPRFFSLRER